jgi:hypothetical protein
LRFLLCLHFLTVREDKIRRSRRSAADAATKA